MRKYVPYILSFFIIAATPVTAQIDTVLQKLKKRYEKAYAWGNGYVLEANSVYAFANKQGKLVRPFTMNSFDTVLSDRAIVYNQWRCGGFYIINADGQDVSGCSNNTYRLISKEKRVFGIIMSNNREVLANDSGRQITFNDHDPNLPVNAFLRTQYFDGRKHLYGIVTKQLDTFLSTTYSSVSFGKDIYAGVRNDSAYVYLRGKGLLFTLPDVGDCIILQNDLIVVKKYGMCALLSRTGQLLTAFRYQKIEDFRYPHSIMPHDDRGHYENPPVIMKYAIVKRGQPQGLIDANGREILPPVYDEISMNTNGWLKVRKAMHDKEFLLDNHFKPVLEADAYDITFVDSRFVTITRSNRYSDDVEIRHYDMQLRKFVKKVPLQKQGRQKPALPTPKTGTECRSNNRDTFCINRAGSVLVRVDGKWGVRSITGDTILPFFI